MFSHQKNLDFGFGIFNLYYKVILQKNQKYDSYNSMNT